MSAARSRFAWDGWECREDFTNAHGDVKIHVDSLRIPTNVSRKLGTKIPGPGNGISLITAPTADDSYCDDDLQNTLEAAVGIVHCFLP